MNELLGSIEEEGLGNIAAERVPVVLLSSVYGVKILLGLSYPSHLRGSG
jgi:hypothetical protein